MGEREIFRRWIHVAYVLSRLLLYVRCCLFQKCFCTCILLESLLKIILFALGFAFCHNVIISEELIPAYIVCLKQHNESNCTNGRFVHIKPIILLIIFITLGKKYKSQPFEGTGNQEKQVKTGGDVILEKRNTV